MALTTNLLAWYKLDEASGNRADSVGSRNLVPTNAPGNTTGKIGSALALNGSSQFCAKTSTSGIVGATAYTLSVWVYDSAVSAGHTIFHVPDGSGTRLILRLLTTSGGGVSQAVLAFPADGTANATTVNNVYSLATWTHLALVYDGSGSTNADKCKIYINGSSQSLTFSGTVPTAVAGSGAETWNVGAVDFFGTSSYFNGNLDLLGVWTRALSGAEVTSLYNSGAGFDYPFTTSTPLQLHATTIAVLNGGAP